MENKWVISSREIITFRKALMNPITAFQFQRFVSLKGDLLENDVLFWREVQKYKVQQCHAMEIMPFLADYIIARIAVVLFRAKESEIGFNPLEFVNCSSVSSHFWTEYLRQ